MKSTNRILIDRTFIREILPDNQIAMAIRRLRGFLGDSANNVEIFDEKQQESPKFYLPGLAERMTAILKNYPKERVILLSDPICYQLHINLLSDFERQGIFVLKDSSCLKSGNFELIQL